MDELRGKLEDKNKTIEKKTGAALHATQEKNRISNELNDLRDQIDIKDRKVNVLQRKVRSQIKSRLLFHLPRLSVHLSVSFPFLMFEIPVVI